MADDMGVLSEQPDNRGSLWTRHPWFLPIGLVLLVVVLIAWGIPIARGFHLGCNGWVDHQRMVRLGIEFCR